MEVDYPTNLHQNHHPHQVIEGKVHGIHRSEISQRYPEKLCRDIIIGAIQESSLKSTVKILNALVSDDLPVADCFVNDDDLYGDLK